MPRPTLVRRVRDDAYLMAAVLGAGGYTVLFESSWLNRLGPLAAGVVGFIRRLPLYALDLADWLQIQ